MSAKSSLNSDSILPLLRFLPGFETEGRAYEHWESPQGKLPYRVYADDVDLFVKAAYDNGWISPFDWGEWQDRAAAYVHRPEKLTKARIGTIQKLLTTHVRKDRFCEGHLIGMFENGHMLAVLRRLKDIVESGKSR